MLIPSHVSYITSENSQVKCEDLASCIQKLFFPTEQLCPQQFCVDGDCAFVNTNEGWLLEQFKWCPDNQIGGNCMQWYVMQRYTSQYIKVRLHVAKGLRCKLQSCGRLTGLVHSMKLGLIVAITQVICIQCWHR